MLRYSAAPTSGGGPRAGTALTCPYSVSSIHPPCVRQLDFLDQHRNALSDADAHRRQSQFDVRAPPHLMQKCCQDACARAPERVSESDRASVRIQALILRIYAPLL